ncbi:type II toxin-antitoxin system Phd/YefM family antitoxin [Mariprofundus sp. EBB-1]|uniref:type II toxin-antitoxin system Phd/YefM family antitoxin n=1 Tax=Mariprofundus sp. EBB-1 TaxID=2650971 RepID=UPI000EF1D297|nr:type II toxin-antitoxin system Phd/YefM family antitoxin [Mariprofundus sp. EBB-1]RLL50796.1 type II toxin-antitoxin system Phd/YefM family antitoxin [Mariprofundus sp. EBB-1]
MRESIISLTQFKSEASQQINALKESSEPLILTQNGHASAVVEDYTQYQKRQKSLAMLRLMVQGETDIQHEHLTSQKDVFKNIRERLKAENNDG